MKKWFKSQNVFLAWVLALLCCSMLGCGSEPSAEEGAKAVYQPRERSKFDLTSDQWTEQGKAEDSGEPWQYTEYWEDSVLGNPEPDRHRFGYLSAACGSDFYILESYYTKEMVGPGGRKCYLTRLNTLTMEAERTEFRFSGMSDKAKGLTQELLDELNAALDTAYLELIDMDMVDGKICLQAVQMNPETKAPDRYCAIWTDTQGMVDGVIDLLPEVKRSGMMQDGFLPEGILCDREGYMYIGGSGYGSIGLYDGDGKFLRSVGSMAGAGKGVSHMGRLPDGRPVFGYNDAGTTVIFCCEDAEEKVLYKGRCTIPQRGYFNDYGEILFMESGWLMRWDASTGKCQRLYQVNGAASLQCVAVIENSAEDISLVLYEQADGGTMVMRLQLGAELEETKLTLFQLYENQQLGKRMEEYSFKHPGVKIELVSGNQEDDFDTALMRLTAQLSEGEGPDMFVLMPEQLELLQDKGILADLTGVLQKEVEEQIFSGVLRCGMVEGRLYGIINEAGICTVAVSEELWPEDTWTWRDVMALMEADRNGFASVFGDSSPLELLKNLVMRDITSGTSSFLDYETKRCNFDSEDFVNVLEFCLKYGSAADAGENSFEEEIKDVQEGRTLAHPIAGNLMTFSRHMAALGEGYKCVGYPTDGKYGGYFACYYCVSVNAASKNRDAAFDVLRYLLSDRGQRMMGINAVRKDILSRHVENGAQPGENPVFRVGGYSIIPLEGKSDGSAFLPEYMEILEGGMQELEFSRAELIIIEEAAMYFAGDRTAKETSEIIQNRVQLYLNEN